MTAAEWEIGKLGEATPPPEEAGAATPPPDGSMPDAAAAPIGWTDEDVRSLEAIIRGPYDKIAEITNDPSYRLSDVDVLMLVGSFTSWMPVSWVRASSHGELPLILAVPLTIGAIVAVNLPKVSHWNRTHPDAAISLPFVGKGGARRDRSRTAATSDSGDGGRAEPSGAPEDHERAAAGSDAGAPAAPVSDGGPAADSIDDIRSGYTARR